MWRLGPTVALFCAAIAQLGGSCGGGSGGGGGRVCDGSCDQRALSVANVELIVAQAAAEAAANGIPNLAVAVLDRVGNVLAVWQQPGASPTTTEITSDRGVTMSANVRSDISDPGAK